MKDETGKIVVCLGELLVDFLAEETGVELGAAAVFRKFPGGAMANVAVGLARLNVRARFVGQVGADPFGRFLCDFLAAEGVDTAWLRVSDRYPTGLVFVALDERRVPRFSFFGNPSADMMLSEDAVNAAALDNTAFLHLGTVSMVREESRAASFKLLRLAEEQGVRVSFDPNFRLHLWRDHELLRRLARESAASSALVKLNEDELRFLTGAEKVEEGAAQVLCWGPAVVVVTQGPAGAYYICGSGEGKVEGYAVEAADTTGAGDGFMAGLLASLLKADWPSSSADLEHAVRQANAVAARVCTARGAVTALPTPSDLAAFLAEEKRRWYE